MTMRNPYNSTPTCPWGDNDPGLAEHCNDPRPGAYAAIYGQHTAKRPADTRSPIADASWAAEGCRAGCGTFCWCDPGVPAHMEDF